MPLFFLFAGTKDPDGGACDLQGGSHISYQQAKDDFDRRFEVNVNGAKNSYELWSWAHIAEVTPGTMRIISSWTVVDKGWQDIK